MELCANYFPFKPAPNCEIHQYNLKFEPAIDDKKTRLRLVASKKDLLGTYIYSGGNLLYTFQQLRLPSSELKVETADGMKYVMAINDRGRIELTSAEALQVMNILLRRTMKGLELQTVGRHLFDASNKVSVV